MELTKTLSIADLAGSAEPGANGNLAIAGHRAGFFRVLKDIENSDLLEDELPGEKDPYSVDVIEIIDKSDPSVLRPSPLRTVTFIACYPFSFAGSAPDRFVVEASRTQRVRPPGTSAQR